MTFCRSQCGSCPAAMHEKPAELAASNTLMSCVMDGAAQTSLGGNNNRTEHKPGSLSGTGPTRGYSPAIEAGKDREEEKVLFKLVLSD